MENSKSMQTPERVKGFNPFPGLRPFTSQESDLFFGREGQTDEVLERLGSNRFVTVIGASGSGKSSLIYCGIVPRLVSSSHNGEPWKLITMRPGNDPLGKLADAMAGEDGKSSGLKNKLELELRKEDLGVEKALAIVSGEKIGNTLLVIDQFEEIFRFRKVQRSGSFSGESKQFVNLIVNAVNRSKANIYIILTMRSDFIGECAHFQGLTSLINESNYLIPHMARDNYIKAVKGPVEYAGAKIDDELLDTLLDEIGSRVDQLPVLQHAMMRTWDQWKKMSDGEIPISRSDYDSIGGMSEAMSRHADEAYEELSHRGREICEVMFRTITEKGNDNKGTRHPTRIGTIASIARCTPEEVYPVIDAFRQPGRSFITPGPEADLNPDTVVDVSHESLMRVWTRLARWVDEEAASVQMYLRLSEASELFQSGKTSLWRPPDLQLAINWRNDNRPTLTWAERYNPAFERAMVYLETSEKEYIAEEENKIKAQKRQLRRSRITAIILGTAAIISVFFMLMAFVKQIEADRNRAEAETARQEAVKQELLAIQNADSARVNAERATAASILAEDNAEEARRNAEFANTQRALAEANADKARLNQLEAEKQAGIARENEIKANENAEIARQEEAKATRLRMVSIGKAMAVKSTQVRGQNDLQGLLAYQAYLFNKQNGGKDNDADIFMGLYNFGKQFGPLNNRKLEGHAGAVKSVSFLGKDSSTFFTTGSDGKVLKWDGNGNGSETIYEGNEIMDVSAVSPDGQMYACGSDRSIIRIFPTGRTGMAYSLEGHSAKIKSIVFTPDNKFLFSSSLDGSIIRWDLQTRQPTIMIEGTDIIVSLDISREGKYMAGATASGTVHLWDLEKGNEIQPIQPPGNGIINVIRFKEETVLSIGYQDGKIEFWDILSAAIVAEVQGHSARVTDIRFNIEKKQMATGATDGDIKLWNVDDLTEPPITFNDYRGYVLSLSFSPDGRVLVSGADSEDGNLVIRPTSADYMIDGLCSLISRNFTFEEWDIYVGEDIEYEATCEGKTINIRVKERKGD